MNEFKNITEKIKLLLKLSSDKDLAERLSMKSQAFSERKRTNSIPHKEILELAITENLDLNELYTESKEIKTIDYKTEIKNNLDLLNDKQIKYIYHIIEAEKLKS